MEDGDDSKAMVGRIALRRVTVSEGPERGAAPGTPMRRQVLIAEADDAVRQAMCRLLPDVHFEVHACADGDDALALAHAHRIDLALLGRDLPRIAGTRLCEQMRRLDYGATIGIVLVSAYYLDPYLGAGDATTFEADAFLPLPASPEVVRVRIATALAQREPIARLGVLPHELAEAIDALYLRIDRINYYELLGVDPNADEPLLRAAFHHLSSVHHPDRYARLRHGFPQVHARINLIYKRITEAWRVLSNEGLRARYNLGLQQRGELRLTKTRASQRQEKELAMCSSEEARNLVLQSLDMRSLGDLEAAEPPMAQACALEPGNADLAQVLAAIRKLIDIMRRG